MNYLETKKMKILIGLVVLFALFQVYKFISVRLASTDLPRGEIVFCSGLHGNNEVYLMNINGTGLQRLTKYSLFGPTLNTWITDLEPSFSFNGRKIAFDSDRDDKGPRIERTRYPGGMLRERSLPTHHDIYTMDSNGERLVRLSYNPFISYLLAYSPDSQKILYYSVPISSDPFYEELKIIDSNGTNGMTLIKGCGVAQLARFSSDSQSVFFILRGDLYSIDIYQGALCRLTHFNNRDINRPDKIEGLPFIDNFALSPNGDKITFVTTEKRPFQFIFYSINRDGSDMKQINKLNNFSRFSYLGRISEIKYSPDGETVVFIGHFDKDGFYVLDKNNNLNFIRYLSGEDSGIESIKNDHLIFTPDSKRIVFVAAFPYYPADDWFTWVKSIGYEIFGNLKYFIFRRISGPYDNKYLCIMDIKTGNFRKIARLPISSNIGRDFIHWEK